MMKIVLFIVAIFALFAMIAVPSVSAVPCNCGDICVNETGWWCDGGAFNPSGTPIQGAIDNAIAGDTICVKDGTYNENVDVTKSHLTIRSENGPSVTTVSASLNPDDHVFDITDQTNVTLKGFEIRDAHGTYRAVAGIYMYNASECNISDNIVTDISATGMFSVACGIYLRSSSDNSFHTSTVYNLSADDGACGIGLEDSSGNSFHTSTVYNLSADDGAYGISLCSSSDNSLHTSTVYNLSANNNALGIGLCSSSDNSFVTSTVYNLSAANNDAYGIYLYSSSDNSFVTTSVYNLSAANNNAYGIYLYSSSDNNSFTSGSISDINAPTWWDFYSGASSHGNSAKDITISSHPTTISFTYDEGIKLKSVETPPADPAGKRNISKYVNVTEVTAESWIFMNVSYEEGDLGGVDENSLRMWKHNGTDWTEVPGTNGVNTAENYVYANITEFSVFAPLGNVPVANPDLVIPEKWLCWPDNCTICYNVTNIGEGTAPACHNTTLYVDGVEVAQDHVPVDLAPGESYIGCFDDYTWTYTPPSDNITVCADNSETLDELDETNNCLTNIWMCGDVNGDRTVNVIDVVLIYKRALDPGYPLDLPWAGDVNCDRNINVIDVVLVYKRALDPGYDLNCCCEEVG